MAKKAGFALNPLFFLQLALGVFFIALGITSLTDYDSTLSELKRAFGKKDTLSLIMAIVELVMGAVLVLGLFMSVSSDLTKLLGFALFALWAVYMVIVFIARDIFEPNFFTWLMRFSWHSVILVSLWLVGRRSL